MLGDARCCHLLPGRPEAGIEGPPLAATTVCNVPLMGGAISAAPLGGAALCGAEGSVLTS